jgi:hypothetical protein
VTWRLLLRYSKRDDGTCKSVLIELSRILEGDRSSNLSDQNITHQAKHILSYAEWSSLEDRYTRNQIAM